MNPITAPNLDVASNIKSDVSTTIDYVGMNGIQIPFRWYELADNQLNGLLNCAVSLDDPDVKGIHMSRLYNLAVDYFNIEAVDPQSFIAFSKELSKTQNDLSKNGFLKLSFELPKKQHSLLSGNYGWIYYPVSIASQIIDHEVSFILSLQLTYSSTCPCSVSLSRELLAKDFTEAMKHTSLISVNDVEEWILTQSQTGGQAHAQRSFATIKLNYNHTQPIPTFYSLIDRFENMLKTPVQGSVKRIDEQEFARLNAKSQKFCEDAVRMLKNEITSDGSINDYDIMVSHEESLHPHNAVARCVKGLPNGFKIND